MPHTLASVALGPLCRPGTSLPSWDVTALRDEDAWGWVLEERGITGFHVLEDQPFILRSTHIPGFAHSGAVVYHSAKLTAQYGNFLVHACLVRCFVVPKRPSTLQYVTT
jgi:hypothetical protein